MSPILLGTRYAASRPLRRSRFCSGAESSASCGCDECDTCGVAANTYSCGRSHLIWLRWLLDLPSGKLRDLSLGLVATMPKELESYTDRPSIR